MDYEQNSEQLEPPCEGYYWVKVRPLNCERPYWQIAYWRDEEWWEFHGEAGEVYDFNRILELGPRIEGDSNGPQKVEG